MRKPSEMYVASRMQDMVQIRARNACFATKLHYLLFATILLGLSVLRAPRWGYDFERGLQSEVDLRKSMQNEQLEAPTGISRPQEWSQPSYHWGWDG